MVEAKRVVAWLCGVAAGPLAAMALALPARADTGDPAAAEALFREARRASAAGDYVTACAKLTESQRLDPASGTLFNLADCEEHIARLASAWEHFARLAETLPASDARREYARTHATALEARLPRLALVLAAGAPPGTRVTRDGVELGAPSLGAAVPVNPGQHAVVVLAPGRPDRAYPVSVAEGQSLRVVVAPSAAPAPAPLEAARPAPAAAAGAFPGNAGAAPEAATHGGSGKHVAGYVILGVGGAALIAGAVFGVQALSQRSESNGNCPGGVCRDQGGVTSYDHARTNAILSDVCFGAGLLAGVGAYFLLSAHAEVAATVASSGPGVRVRLAW